MKQGIKSPLDLAICNCKICDSALNEIDKTQFEIDVTKAILKLLLNSECSDAAWLSIEPFMRKHDHSHLLRSDMIFGYFSWLSILVMSYISMNHYIFTGVTILR